MPPINGAGSLSELLLRRFLPVSESGDADAGMGPNEGYRVNDARCGVWLMSSAVFSIEADRGSRLSAKDGVMDMREEMELEDS